MLVKILKKILRIPRKIFKVILILYFDTLFFLKGNLLKIQKKQLEIFNNNGLNRAIGEKKLIDLNKKYSILNSSMSSEHQTIFASLSETGFNPKNILEIGTYDGKNAFLLSKLFPKSKILTLDLKDNSEDFTQSYNRNTSEYLNKFIINRNKILEQCNNISFIQKNSLNLIFENKTFDLIWIDGSHGYPIVPIDISNSIRLISSDGIIMCDDIHTTKNLKSDDIYKSFAGKQTLEALKDANIIKYCLFYKRINYRENSIPMNRKYVAYIKRLYENSLYP